MNLMFTTYDENYTVINETIIQGNVKTFLFHLLYATESASTLSLKPDTNECYATVKDLDTDKIISYWGDGALNAGLVVEHLKLNEELSKEIKSLFGPVASIFLLEPTDENVRFAELASIKFKDGFSWSIDEEEAENLTNVSVIDGTFTFEYIDNSVKTYTFDQVEELTGILMKSVKNSNYIVMLDMQFGTYNQFEILKVLDAKV